MVQYVKVQQDNAKRKQKWLNSKQATSFNTSRLCPRFGL